MRISDWSSDVCSSDLGPVGAALGAAIGRQADAAIFAPRGREGPRLVDLKVQASTYGQQIPQLFGTMRVAGSVIWATDLIERRTKRSEERRVGKECVRTGRARWLP